MVCEHEIVKTGNKKYVIVNCANCANNSSLGNITCFRRISTKIRENPYVQNMVFKRNYRKVLEESSFKILKEYLETAQMMKEAEVCNECYEKFSVLKFKLEEDPIGAILHLMDLAPCDTDKKYFDSVKNDFKKTKLWELIEKNRGKHSEAELYHVIFRDRILPGFISFFVEPLPERYKELDSYEIAGANIKIYTVPEKPYPVYHITPSELNLSRKELMILSHAFVNLSKKEFDLTRGEAVCQESISEAEPGLSKEKVKELASVLLRYSFGYGIIEVLLKDPKLQDVFVDSPGDKPIYVYHQDYEECVSNIVLSSEELEKLSTRFRLLSGRPFDESFPVLHADIKDLKVRIAGITEPLTFGGTGFAFRKHKIQPWTLQQFIANKMLTPMAAGLISFLIDGQQSILITGPRGSGKTSFLGALISEISQNFRIITIEDTPELPIEQLRDIGFNIQHIKIKSTLQREAYEVSADEALRSALRLGESVLVIGEVRGEEARALFEAMRIGAAGNVVLGTIHGSSAYDVWDRIVNDLNVPSTSFKAADIIINCAPIRVGEGLKRHRRVLGVTEVLKHWQHEPSQENGFLELMSYNRKKDRLEISELKKSHALQSIIKRRGMSMKEALKSIELRAKIKEEIVKASKKKPHLLSVEFAAESRNKFFELTEGKRIRYGSVLAKFKKWLKEQ